MKATHLLQGLHQPVLEDLSIYHVVKKTKENKKLQRETEKEKKRAEAIWTRLSCLKFLQDQECKSRNKDLKKKQGKTDFFGTEWFEKKALKEKKERKLKQIYLEKEKTQRNIIQ
jgi:hypothetical protein